MPTLHAPREMKQMISAFGNVAVSDLVEMLEVECRNGGALLVPVTVDAHKPVGHVVKLRFRRQRCDWW